MQAIMVRPNTQQHRLARRRLRLLILALVLLPACVSFYDDCMRRVGDSEKCYFYTQEMRMRVIEMNRRTTDRQP